MRNIALLFVLVLVGCGPLTSKQKSKKIPLKEKNTDVILGQSDKESSSQHEQIGQDTPPENPIDGSPDTAKKITVKNSPMQSPNQSPSQTPHQGKLVTEDLPPLEIDSISTSGAGCSESDVATNISDDNQAFTMVFDQFFAGFDPEDETVEASIGCQIDLDFAIPSGWRFSIVGLDYRGYANLGDEDTAFFTTDLSVPGSNPVNLESTLVGIHDDDFEIREEISVSSRHWYGCDSEGDTLTIDLNLRIDNQSGEPNEVNLDSVDGEMVQKLAIAWEKCS